MKTMPYIEYRCPCGRLLFKGILKSSLVEIKCRRCGELRSFGKQCSRSVERYGFVIREDGSIISASESAAAMLGYSNEEFCSMHVSDLYPYVSTASVLPKLSATHFIFNETHLTKEGSVVHVRVQREQIGRSSRSELYQCEVAPVPISKVQDSPAHGVSAHEFVMEIDSVGRCTFASEIMAKEIGRSSSELLGEDFFELLREEDGARVRNYFQVDQWLPLKVEQLILHSEDSREFVLYVIPLHHDDGDLRSFMLIFEPCD